MNHKAARDYDRVYVSARKQSMKTCGITMIADVHRYIVQDPYLNDLAINNMKALTTFY